MVGRMEVEGEHLLKNFSRQSRRWEEVKVRGGRFSQVCFSSDSGVRRGGEETWTLWRKS